MLSAGDRFSEFLEESKAAPASMVERAMVEVHDEIESPVLPGPLPPGQRRRLAGKAGQNRVGADELVGFFSEPCIQGEIVLFVPSLCNRNEAGRRDDGAGVADI